MTSNSDDIRAIPSGHSLSDYKFEKVLGQGSFGITYLATDTMLNRKVAIKEYFPREFAARDNTLTVRAAGNSDDRDNFIWGLKRFLDEARVLAVFDHPNIIQVRRFFEANGTAYLVMDYCDGTPLDELLKIEGFLSEKKIHLLISPLLDALEIIHKTNFLHRDIKPANIFIKKDGTPVLLDFGAARQELVTHSKSVTAMATPGYAAFEQYSSRGNQGPWTDIYGLGATIYKAITGSKPDDATNRMLDDTLVPCEKICKGKYSAKTLRAIDKSMAVKPQDRPQSISEWRAMLDLPSVSDGQGGNKSFGNNHIYETAPLTQDIDFDIKPKPEEEKSNLIVNSPELLKETNHKKYITAGALVISLIAIGLFFMNNESENIVADKNSNVTPISIPENKQAIQATDSKNESDKPQNTPSPKKSEITKVECSKGSPISSWNNCIGNHIYPSGASYEGEWVSGKRSGKGKGVSNNGNRYVGDWLNDNFHGYGVLTFAAGDEYKGNFLNGYFSGKGIYTWPSGDRHDGLYSDGKSNGYGTYYYKNGRKYVGNFVNSKFEGQGAMYDSGGRVLYSGAWANGSAQGPTVPDSANRESSFSKCRDAATNAKKTTALPRRLDNITVLTDMFCAPGQADKATFIYRYEIDSSDRFNQDLLNKILKEDNKKLVCGPDLKVFLPIVDFEYQYFYSSSSTNFSPKGLIGKLRYSASDCR
jgi:serine/threonine protein kinase